MSSMAQTATPATASAERRHVLLSPSQSAALRYLDRLRSPGAVLAPWYLSMSVPGFTGREVYAGHPMWQPSSHVARADLFYAPSGTTAATRRAILRRSGVRFVIDDCDAPAVADAITPITRPVARFGCVTVYRYAPQPS
jgi:hypothetical protein